MQKSFQVIVFHSFKGGSGKTTFAINFASQLTDLGYKVLIIENDLQMPTYTEIFQDYWEDRTPKNFWNSYLLEPSNSRVLNLINNTKLGFDVICTDPDFDPQQLYSLTDPKLFRNWLITLQRTKLELEKSGFYDFIILDCAPGWHFLIINNLIITDTAIIVTRMNKYEMLGTKKMIEEIYLKTRQWENNLYLIWNQVPRVEQDSINTLLNSYQKTLMPLNVKVNPLGTFSNNDQYSFESAQGIVLLKDSKAEEIKENFRNLVRKYLDSVL